MNPQIGALFVQIAYIAASAAFILGLRGLTKPDTARRGMQLAAAGMLLAIIGTLLNHEIITYEYIIIGLVVGSAIGLPMGLLVPMTAMPQRIAVSHMFGALAVTLVGIAEFLHYRDVPGGPGAVKMVALGFETIFGALTITGSFMAFGEADHLPRPEDHQCGDLCWRDRTLDLLDCHPIRRPWRRCR